MKELLNCPNCGAPIQDDHCPYCGSVFLDWAAFDLAKPTFVKVRDHQGRFLLIRLSTPSVRITLDSSDVPYFYADNRRIPMKSTFPRCDIEAEFTAIPYRDAVTGKDVLYKIIAPHKMHQTGGQA